MCVIMFLVCFQEGYFVCVYDNVFGLFSKRLLCVYVCVIMY